MITLYYSYLMSIVLNSPPTPFHTVSLESDIAQITAKCSIIVRPKENTLEVRCKSKKDIDFAVERVKSLTRIYPQRYFLFYTLGEDYFQVDSRDFRDW